MKHDAGLSRNVVHELETPLAVIDATTSAVLDGVDEQRRPPPRDDPWPGAVSSRGSSTTCCTDRPRRIGRPDPPNGAVPRRPRSSRGSHPPSVRPLPRRVVRSRRASRPASWSGRNADRLRQAIAAPLDDAIRHAPGLRSPVDATPRPGGVRVEVRDGGPGTPAADPPARLRASLDEADESRDRTAGTSGLGLAIVKAIADAHGASVGAANVTTGGARFWIDLPNSTG